MSGRRDPGLPQFWADEAPAGPGAIADPAAIRAILIDAAREGRAVSYSEILGLLGHRFTRPRMRALCATLGAVDGEAAQRGEPELAVLIVRESDRLPGQGWWVSGGARDHGYDGPWEGAEARAFIDALQARTFAYWAAQPSAAPGVDATGTPSKD